MVDGKRLCFGEEGYAVARKKRDVFSAAKAVKANARERVGQPKPARVIDEKPKTGRQAKYNPKLEKVVEQEE